MLCIRSTHSIADSVALAIDTPVGMILHTSDFKIDQTPIEGEPIDLARIAEIGKKGVLLLMADSTNVERPGYTMSEKTVGETLDNVFKSAKSRIIAATFASNIHRIQQIVNSAVKFNRKVALSGRSMINVAKTAMKLGYLNIPSDTLMDIEKIQKLPPEQIVMITTGSQGEPMSALTRIALATHRKVGIEKGDLVIISASPVPGNEKFVSRVINDLFKQGADVIYEDLADIHVSGHAKQEELKLMHRLVKPKFFMPVHGEFRHLKQHANLAQSLGMNEQDIFLIENGQILELTRKKAQITGSVQSGSILVDGLGVGDVGNIVLRDRKHLSEDGLIVIVAVLNSKGNVVCEPDVISRGFVYVKEAETLMDEIRVIAKESIEKSMNKKKNSYNAVKNNIKDELGSCPSFIASSITSSGISFAPASIIIIFSLSAERVTYMRLCLRCSAVGFIITLPSMYPRIIPPIGPLKGISEMHNAVIVPIIEANSGELSCSTDNTILTIDTSFLRSLGNLGRICLSITLAVNTALSEGFPSLFINPPGIFPTEYSFLHNPKKTPGTVLAKGVLRRALPLLSRQLPLL
jgi:ribonuclease J